MISVMPTSPATADRTTRRPISTDWPRRALSLCRLTRILPYARPAVLRSSRVVISTDCPSVLKSRSSATMLASRRIFDVVDDPLERANLKDHQPDVYKRLVQSYQE